MRLDKTARFGPKGWHPNLTENKQGTMFSFRSLGRIEARLGRRAVMFRAVVEEAAALASLSLFLGMIAIWAQVLGGL